MKEITDKTSKVAKTLSLVLGLFLASIGTWTIIKKWQTKDISGEWKIKFNTKTSTYKAYIGDCHTQKVFFIQDENSITGTGEKCEYNGVFLPSEQHRKIEYQGKVDKNTFRARYQLYGLKRETSGEIVVTISSDGQTLSGRFSGTAANTEGTVEGEKLN